jgi:hypothetical protein
MRTEYDNVFLSIRKPSPADEKRLGGPIPIATTRPVPVAVICDSTKVIVNLDPPPVQKRPKTGELPRIDGGDTDSKNTGKGFVIERYGEDPRYPLSESRSR